MTRIPLADPREDGTCRTCGTDTYLTITADGPRPAHTRTKMLACSALDLGRAYLRSLLDVDEGEHAPEGIDLDALRAALDDPPAEGGRSYVLGLPVVMTVHPDGRVSAEVDLSEADDLFDSSTSVCEGQPDDEDTLIADKEVIAAAVEARAVIVT